MRHAAAMWLRYASCIAGAVDLCSCRVAVVVTDAVACVADKQGQDVSTGDVGSNVLYRRGAGERTGRGRLDPVGEHREGDRALACGAVVDPDVRGERLTCAADVDDHLAERVGTQALRVDGPAQRDRTTVAGSGPTDVQIALDRSEAVRGGDERQIADVLVGGGPHRQGKHRSG